MTLAARFLNRPLALLPDQADIIRHGLDGEPVARTPNSTAAAGRDYSVTEGIAVVPVVGALSHGPAWSWCDETSYDSIRRSLAHALASPAVRAIALHINSPGGDVAGMLDLADVIFRMRGTKPIWAILNETAYSAAYCLASAADRIIVPRTGGTGSIGVIVLHTDLTGALDKAGVKVTTIQYGARKSEGSPFEPLKAAALQRIQDQVDALGAMFVRTVARNRGLSRSSVAALEGGVLLGADGVKAGLADAVMSPDEAFLSLLASLPKSSAIKAMRV